MRKKLEVHWSNESVRRIDNILSYLSENWSDKESTNFLKSLDAFEEIVSYFPEIYPESLVKSGFKRAVISKQISVIYSIRRNVIEVHTVFDNRQNPDKLL
jgi:plasmid stabilization system protein ParE